MAWTELWFGKHRVLTLPQVLFKDPDWFFWAWDGGVFADKENIQGEVEEISRKARTIRILQQGDEPLVVEHYIHGPTRKYAKFDIVPSSRPEHKGASPTFRESVIDMSVPRRLASRDKLGYRHFLGDLQSHLFGDSRHVMTKKRCEAFFDDGRNFAL